MKGSPCCAGLMRSCLHTYRTKTNLTQHIIQPWGGGDQPSMGGPSGKYVGEAIRQVWGGHQPSMGGVINQLWGGAISQVWGGHQPTMGGHQPSMGGVINQLWGGHQPSMGGGIFPPVCTGSQNQHIRPAVCKQNGRTKNSVDKSETLLTLVYKH